MDVKKHIQYWLRSADEDWDIAQDLVDRKKVRHGLFFAHLALEKVFKAHVCRTTQDVAPRIHHLLRLAETTNLYLSQDHKAFLAEFDQYQLEGRYPENLLSPPTPGEAKQQLQEAGEIFQWLTRQL